MLQKPLGRLIISPLSTPRAWGQVADIASCEVTTRLRDVTFPYDIWFSELLSHPLVLQYGFIVPEKWDLNIRKRFFIIKRRGSLHSYAKFCYFHWDQNTWKNLHSQQIPWIWCGACSWKGQWWHPLLVPRTLCSPRGAQWTAPAQRQQKSDFRHHFPEICPSCSTRNPTKPAANSALLLLLRRNIR